MQQAQNTREASYTLAQMSITKRNALLLAMADNLDAHEKEIFAINEKDVLKAKAEGLSSALVDRLTLTPSRFLEMVEGVRKASVYERTCDVIILYSGKREGLTESCSVTLPYS